MIHAATCAVYVGLMLGMSCALRASRILRDMQSGTLDLSNLMQFQFEALSAGMLLLMSTALPN
jgi:hypothetical protein